MKNSRALLYHNLAVMLKAGVPILKALQTVASGSKEKYAQGFLEMARDVSTGSSLAESMNRYPDIYPRLDYFVVEAGETSGTLPETFDSLSQWYSLQDRMRKTMVSGMVLPFLILHVAAFISPLPQLLLGNMSIGQFFLSVAATLLFFYIPCGIILVLIHLRARNDAVRLILDKVILKIPLLGRAVHNASLGRFCRAFHILLVAGVPGGKCMQNAAEVAGNVVVKNLVQGGVDSCYQGNPISEGFSSRLPLHFLHAWQVGEETGDLDDVTLRLADHYADSAKNLFIEFARWLPRVVYTLVCLLVIVRIFQGFANIYPMPLK